MYLLKRLRLLLSYVFSKKKKKDWPYEFLGSIN